MVTQLSPWMRLDPTTYVVEASCLQGFDSCWKVRGAVTLPDTDGRFVGLADWKVQKSAEGEIQAWTFVYNGITYTIFND